MKKIVITGAVILMLFCLAGINKSLVYTESGSSVPSESEVKELAGNAIDNNSVPPVISETNTLHVKADTSGHETFTAGEENTLPHYIYWTDPNEVFGMFLMGYLKITFDPAVVEPVRAQSGAFSTGISRQGPGWIIVDPWMWYPGESDPNLLAFNIIWRGKQTGITGFSYTVTDSGGNYRGYFLTGTVHNMQRVTAVVEYATQAPVAPTNLAATAASSSQINLTWQNNADNAQGVIIERQTSYDGTYEQITTVAPNVTAYNDYGLANATIYSYRVKAYNQAGNSCYSNLTAAVTFARIPPLSEVSDLLANFYSNGLIKNYGIYNSLNAKVINAQNALNYNAILGHLNALTNQLNALKENSIDPVAKQQLLTLVQALAEYNDFRSSLPATTRIYIAGYPNSNDITIALSSETGCSDIVNIAITGNLIVEIAPTANQNIASVTIVQSEYASIAPVIINGIDFGTLWIFNDPDNPSVGTLDLTNGHLEIVENVLVRSLYLKSIGISPMPVQVPQTGTFYPMSLTRGVALTVGTPVILSSTSWLGGIVDWMLYRSSSGGKDTPEAGSSKPTPAQEKIKEALSTLIGLIEASGLPPDKIKIIIGALRLLQTGDTIRNIKAGDIKDLLLELRNLLQKPDQGRALQVAQRINALSGGNLNHIQITNLTDAFLEMAQKFDQAQTDLYVAGLTTAIDGLCAVPVPGQE